VGVNTELERLVRGESHDPWQVLSWHPQGNEWVVRVFVPGAARVSLRDDSGVTYPLDAGTYEGIFERRFALRFEYVVEAEFRDGSREVFRDPYAYCESFLTDFDLYLFNEGRHLELGSRLGCQRTSVSGAQGWNFAVWAPNAVRVSVVGDFNRWDGRRHQMRSLGNSGVWEIFIPDVPEGSRYKYELRASSGEILLKSDPYGRRWEVRPNNATVVGGVSFAWDDGEWRSRAARKKIHEEPMAIYEVHLGSWRRRNGSFLTYRELAEELPAYVADMGFSWVEFLPVTEHPHDGSWGYHTTGFFAPTSRYGAPEDFCLLVDRLHRAGIGVIADWTPAHFPRDEFGLYRFDGTHLYEHADPRLRDHPDWGSVIFNYARKEVRSFLLSSACTWLRDFHLDGLRVDAVASMLYRDYSRPEGQWVPNVYGGREDLDAISLLREMNTEVYRTVPGAFTVAEESTAWPMVSRPVYLGGLGFGFKWNMGWMHDILHYISLDPIHRKYHHRDLTFSFLYAFSENFILPLSHDEVVHGKRALISKMPGDWWQKRANLRLLLCYQYCHPGKKLLFMGSEFGQTGEWNHLDQVEWHLLQHEEHRQIRDFVRDLNTTYHRLPALWQNDADQSGFSWIDCADADASVISFLRKGCSPDDFVIAVFNFTPVPRHHYRIGVPLPGVYREILNTDSSLYGGSNTGNRGSVTAEPVSRHGRPFSVSLTLPPLAGILLSPGREGTGVRADG